eukprot:scaffold14370_cov75-Attheya_sp.AAC.1
MGFSILHYSRLLHIGCATKVLRKCSAAGSLMVWAKTHREPAVVAVACDTPSHGTPRNAQREMITKKEQEASKEEQTKESGLSFDPNIRLGPKLDPNMPLHTS